MRGQKRFDRDAALVTFAMRRATPVANPDWPGPRKFRGSWTENGLAGMVTVGGYPCCTTTRLGIPSILLTAALILQPGWGGTYLS